MKYPRLSKFLKRRQVEISQEKGYLVTQKELAEWASTPDYPIGQRSMGHWFGGSAMPESWFWPGLYRVFRSGFYAAIGHPELEPEDIDPRLQLLIDNQGNPGIDALLDQIEKNKDAILKADKPVRLVTFAT